ncbi:N-acetylmannosaminyltransferase [Chlorobaculum limnaeum]|uniref:N-acetylmannosaminyltransferase n=1 Tax=Chlorobaculum limnaeum TaxID=274537 RepID=A0A1D8D1B0_CHLLM|nr:WecB/TagA/CpsF family glycosyltransferase [Chlorobaculum limnaeum]AOS84171.1 N-acetylmannosaminyltransferase [Chlorobaculum limnaeum]
MTDNRSAQEARALEKRLSGRSKGRRGWRRHAAFAVSTALSELIVRLIEIGVALSVTLFAFVPVLLARLAHRLPAGKPVFSKRAVFGRSGKPLTLLSFDGLSGGMATLPWFLELFTGRIALAGTAIRDWHPAAAPEQGYISMVKPGIVSLWNVRQSSRIAHEGREATEWEYIFSKRPAYDFLLILRALPALLFSEKEASPSPLFNLLDLKIDNISMREAISMIRQSIEEQRQSAIFFVNPDCMNKSVTDRGYRKALASADHILPDGIGLVIAGKMLGTPLCENINGTDMLPFLCEMAASQKRSIYLLGGKPGVAEKAGDAIAQNHGVTIAGAMHGYFDHETESAGVIEAINRSNASILLVAFGAPLQEQWIVRHRAALRPAILMGVGGLFDFFSGNIQRAPRWMREIGLEWVYRILQEPGRMWKRYVVGNPLFLYRVMKWKVLGQSSNPENQWNSIQPSGGN